jgi:hypothetical protein
MKTIVRLTVLLALFCGILQAQTVPTFLGQMPTYLPGQAFQVGLTWPALSSGSGSLSSFNVTGLQFYTVNWVVNGSISACAFTLDGATIAAGSYTTGSIVSSQVCNASGTFTTATATENILAQLTYTFSGAGKITFTVRGYTENPALSSGASSNVTVTNFPGSQPVSGTVNTQPAGFGAIVSFQQAVTASAVVLATNAVHGFCVKALTTNALTVYVGPSGVSTATGYPLAAGESICYQASNTNLAFVISSNTGSSVAVSGN